MPRIGTTADTLSSCTILKTSPCATTTGTHSLERHGIAQDRQHLTMELSRGGNLPGYRPHYCLRTGSRRSMPVVAVSGHRWPLATATGPALAPLPLV